MPALTEGLLEELHERDTKSGDAPERIYAARTASSLTHPDPSERLAIDARCAGGGQRLLRPALRH